MVYLTVAGEAFRNALAWICLRGAVVLFALLALWWLANVAGETISKFWRKLTAVGRAVVCAMLLVCVIYGGGKTNNVPPNMNQPLPQMQQGGGSFLTGFTGLTGLAGAGNLVNLINPVQTTGEDIVRGYRVESVATNAAPFAAMPSNAVEYAMWSRRGGRETWFPLGLGDFVLPLGTNRVSRLRVLSGGMVETFPALNGPGSVCAAREAASLVPGVSRFWSADAEGGAKVLRWDGVFAERDGTGEYTAEMRFFPNGDFTTRSNEVETVCRRVNPDDWDGDGIVNDSDANPCTYDGDFFGPGNVLPEGANSNAYCTVSLVVDGYDSLVSFLGEGSSNYPDPRFVARAGETNDVLILIGKVYHVSSDAPVRCVGVSDPGAEVVVHDYGGFSVVRPVEISFADEGDPPLRMMAGLRSGTSGGRSFTVSVLPACLDGEFLFESCCPIEGSGLSFSYLHDIYCHCSGCQPRGRYKYEGFGITVYPPSCCCSVEGSGGGGGTPEEVEEPSAENPLFASFSLPFALFEDSYLNEVGGSRVGARARPVTLNVGVYAGSYGGSWTLTIANEGKLRQTAGTTARSGTVSAGEALSLEMVYVFASPSDSTDDIVATVTFTENFTGANSVDTATLTAVKLELEARMKVSDATRHRHYFGVAEDVVCSTTPNAVPGLSFSATKGSYNPTTGWWTCPVSTSLEFGGLNVCYGGETVYAFMTTTTPPTGVVVEHAVGLDFNVPAGTAGGAGMVLDLYVLPKSVSFSKLSLAEVPTTTEGPTGYFTNMEFSAVWHHTTAMGAGDWKRMGRLDTHWFDDNAKMGDAFPSRDALEWDAGTIIWDVPVAWDLWSLAGGDYSKRIPVLYKQRFDFSANGTLRVTKHGFWEERDADNTKRGSEGINVWTNPPTEP